VSAREKGRATFTLDAEHTSLVRNLVDRCERAYGFRPSMAQIINGLIYQALQETPDD
jgi:hypothetical protein